MTVHRRIVAALAACASCLPGAATAQAQHPAYAEPFRPQFHFTPAQNWMNDPNGLVYYAGEYHLFFQYNPFGDTWGHMSWGHAVSRDLVHWQQLPVAIPELGDEMAFSGGAVVDHENTSGFGTRENPPMVAIYTAAKPGDQEQALAYSLDKGRTWTRYAGNPVLDIDDPEFRDPKVFWYAPERKWVMVVARAVARRIELLQLSESQGLDVHERLRARRGGRGRLGVPGPVRAWRQVGHGRQPQPGRDQRRLGRPVLRRRLRRQEVHRRRRRPLHPACGRRLRRLRGRDVRWLDDHGKRVRLWSRARHAARPTGRLGLPRWRARELLHRLRQLAGHAHLPHVHDRPRLHQLPRRRWPARARARDGRRYAAGG